jgi:HAMP domain-containing protein
MSENPNNPPNPEQNNDANILKQEEEFARMVQMLVMNLQTQVETMCNTVLERMDEMADRVGDLEKSIGVLVDQAGIDKAKFAEEVNKERSRVTKDDEEK